MRRWIGWIALGGLAVAVGSRLAGQAGVQTTLVGPGDRVVIVAGRHDPITELAVRRLADYFQNVTGTLPATASEPDGESAFTFSFEQTPLPYFRHDGFRLTIDAGRRRALIQAPAPVGFKYGVQRLILDLKQVGDSIEVSSLTKERDPFIQVRDLFIAEIEWHPTESEARRLDALQRQFSWLNWEPERLRRYVEMTEAFGYNGVMLSDSDQMRLYAGESTPEEEGLDKVRSMMRHARRRGMASTFFLWGQKGDGKLVENPRDPSQMAAMQAYWERMIDRYDGFADRWILHWADPGGCKLDDCTVNTPQEATNRFYDLLQRKGASGRVDFSLWALRWGSWPGYESWRSVLDAGVLHPAIGISLMRTFQHDVAQAINEQFRTAGVWGWYLNDIEIDPSLHVHAKSLENEFRKMHASASTLLEWYSLEDNNHVLDAPSLYVGGQLLWDPKASGTQLLNEFCRGVWGPAAGPAVCRALEVIGEVRDGDGVPLVRRDLWPHGSLCWRGQGTAWPDRDLRHCQEALKGLETAQLDPRFVPQFPIVFQPRELLDQVRAHLGYVRDFAAIRLGYQEAMGQAYQNNWIEAQRRMAALPVLPDEIPGSYGAMEIHPYRRLKVFADLWKGRRFADNLALGKAVTASSHHNNDPRFGPAMAVNGLLCEYKEEGWAADRGGPAWLKIDLGEVKTIRSVRIYNRGYNREVWDNKLTATPVRGEVYVADADARPETGALEGPDSGYRLLGGFDDWKASDDPGAYREVESEPARGRFVKVVLHSDLPGIAAGAGEIEVR